MTITPLNSITPGTGAAVAVNVNKPTVTRANKLSFRADPDNDGNIFIGDADMNTATLSGVIEVLQPGERLAINDEAQSNPIQLDRIFLKGATGTGKLIAAAYVR